MWIISLPPSYIPAVCVCVCVCNCNWNITNLNLPLVYFGMGPFMEFIVPAGWGTAGQQQSKLRQTYSKAQHVFRLPFDVWNPRCVFFLLIRPRPEKPVSANTHCRVGSWRSASEVCYQTKKIPEPGWNLSIYLTGADFLPVSCYPGTFTAKLYWNSPGPPGCWSRNGVGSALHLNTRELQSQPPTANCRSYMVF